MKGINFDPRGKMLTFLVACFFAMNISGFIPLIVFTTFILLLLILSGEIKTGLAMYAVFLVGASISYLALQVESSIWSGLVAAIFAFFRLFMPTIMGFVLLFKTTKISEFMSAFEKLHMPYVVVIPFTVMFRFFPTVQEEWRGIRQAMSFRGIGLGAKGLVMHPVRSVEHILVPLLFSCVTIMDELVAASLARGLDTDKKRTCYFTLKMKWYDYVISAIALVFFSMIFFVK